MNYLISSCLRRIAPAALVAAATIAGPAAAWNSALYPSADGVKFSRATVNYNGRAWQMPDFSYAGYQLGASAPGTGIPCRIERVTAPGATAIGSLVGGLSTILTGTVVAPGQPVATASDISSNLQAAVDRVGAAGGGTVILPAGSYALNRSIAARYNNVSIVGAGSGKTTLTIPASYRPTKDDEEGVFTFGPGINSSNKAWLDQGKVLGTVTQRAVEGASNLVMANAGSVAIGQWVVIQQYYWTALARRNDSSGTWLGYDSATFPPAGTPSRKWSFVYLRKVTAKSGNTITLDAPLPMTLDPVNNAIGVRSVDIKTNGSSMSMRENLGLAGVTLSFEDNANGAGGYPSGVGVYFEGVRNGWVHDVQVKNAPRHGISIESSARINVTDSAVQRVQNVAGSGRGYGFLISASQNILLARNYVEMARHGFTTQFGLNSVIVLTRNESAGLRMNADDTHVGFTQQLLWDNHNMTYGTGLHLTYRGAASSNAQETNYSSVVWNPTDNGYRGTNSGGMISLNPSVDGYTMLIGGPKTYPVVDDSKEVGSGNVFPTLPGIQIGALPELSAPGVRNQNVVVEGLYSAGLTPVSLYDSQSTARTPLQPAAFTSNGCYAAPGKGAVVRASYTGTGMLVFNGDRLGWAPAFGSGCPTSMESGDLTTTAATCSAFQQRYNTTSGGRYSLSLLPTASSGSPIVSFGGPRISTSTYRTLTMKIYPVSATFTASVNFQDRPATPNAAAIQLGTVNLSKLPANTWTTVAIPLTGVRAGDYNSIVLKSLGSTSASRVYIDDVTLQ